MYSIKDLSKLQKRSFRNQEGVFLIEGKKIIEEALSSNQPIVQFILTETFQHTEQDFLKKFSIFDSHFSVISNSNAERLTSSKTPAGIFAVVKKTQTDQEKLFSKTLIVIFEDIKDPGNLGTMIRTADWFGVDAVITTTKGADPYNDKVLRSTMGSIFHLPVFVSDNLENDIKKLKEKNFRIIVTRPESKPTEKPTNRQSRSDHFVADQLCLIMGNESLGTSPEIDALADSYFSIPQFGQAESLNVAVSFGIVMHELHKKSQ